MRGRMLMSVFALLLLVASPLTAQSEWLAAEGTSVALEFRHPSLAEEVGDDDLGALDGAWFLSGRFQLPVVGLAAVAELPYARSSLGEGDYTIGNLYVGAELPVALGTATIEAGLRLPTANAVGDDDVSAGIGLFSSIVDRYDAFLDDLITPRLGVRTGLALTDLIAVEVNAAGAYMIFTGEGATDNDFVVDYGVRGFAGLAGARLGAGYEGMWILTTEDDAGDDADRFDHVGLWLDYGIGMVRPGISYFIPLGDYGDLIDGVLGVSIEVDLPM